MPNRIWPATPNEAQDDASVRRDVAMKEAQDHASVLRAVATLGRRQLRFTVDDVRRELRQNLHATLNYPNQLHRHITTLTPVTIIDAGQPLSAFIPRVCDELARGAMKSMHLYALADREHELASTPPDLTAPARVYVAVWVAMRAYDLEAVSTHAITGVCQAIPDLTVDIKQQMTMRLTNLAKRAIPLVKAEAARGADGAKQRWTRWVPVGSRPEDTSFAATVPCFDAWVETVRALKGPFADLGGYATQHELLSDLVTLAIKATKSPVWPNGHSVTVQHIESVCAESSEARALRDRLERLGTTVGRALGDASKARIGGRRRAERRVVKVGAVEGEQACYDVPTLKGYEERTLYVAVQEFKQAARREHLDRLIEERNAALALSRRVAAPEAARALTAITAVRVLLATRDLLALERQGEALLEKGHTLSTATRNAVAERLNNVQATRTAWRADLDEVTSCARAAVDECGLDLGAILSAHPPIVVGAEYVEWMPRAQRASRSPAELLADAAVVVRRFPNPHFVDRKSSDPRAAAITGLDRVGALLHLAERQGAATLAFLQSGAHLLGMTLREGALLVRLLEANDSRFWGAALAALVLLGHPAAEDTACATIELGVHTDRLVHSVYALSVLRRPMEWPQALIERADPQVLRALQAVAKAKRTSQWLL